MKGFSWKCLTILLMVALVSSVAYAADPAEGFWKSVSEETNKVTAYWQLKVEGGVLNGYMVSYPDMKPTDTCTKCDDEFENKPTVGTAWLHLTRLKKGKWDKGYIWHTGKGKQYKAEVWVEGGKLKVKGKIAFFSATQTWIRATKENAEAGKF